MSFIDARLNSRYRYGFVGGPNWNTMVTQLQSGRNRKRKAWAMPHHKYTANYATFNEAEKAELLNAFMAAGGSFSSFRFKDWNDWQAFDQVIGTGDGTSTPMQLVKHYTFGPTTFTRTITLPLNVVVKDEDGNVLSVTVAPTTGLVTPSSPWPSGKDIIASFDFDVRVSFSQDFNPFTSVAAKVRECMVELEEAFD